MGGAESKFAQIYKEHSLEGAFYVLLRALERHYVKQTKDLFAIVNKKVNQIERKDIQTIKSQLQTSIQRSEYQEVLKLQEIKRIMNDLYKEKQNSLQKQFRQEIKQYLPTAKNQPCHKFKGIKEGLKFLYEYDSAPEETKKQIEEECKKPNRFQEQYNLLLKTATEDKVAKLKGFLPNFETNFKNIRQEARKLQESRQKKRLEEAKKLGLL